MPLRVVPAEKADVPALVDIQFSAFRSSLARHLKPDMPPVREYLQSRFGERFSQPYARIYKVIDDNENGDKPPELIAAAIWTSPHIEEPSSNTSPSWLAEEDLAKFQGLFRQAGEKRQSILGDRQHWHLVFLGTMPTHQRRGAGSLLMEEFCRQVDADDHCAYLEASKIGRPLYERFGFVTKDTFGAEVDGETTTNCCMLREVPGKKE